MPFEQERVAGDKWLPVWVRNEHLARYRFAASLATGKVVVDCACGDGLSSRFMAEAGATRVYGYDLSPEAIEYARRVNAVANTQFEVASATALPVDDDAADLFVSLETIEHLDDVDAYLAEVVRVLRPDGTFICSTPNRFVYSPGHTAGSRPWNPFHVREYSLEELTRLLRRYFGQVEMVGQNLRPKWQATAMHSLGRFLPFDLAVRLNQAMKLPRFAYDKLEHHSVVALDGRREPEALVALCANAEKT